MRDGPIHLPQGALRQSDGAVVWRIWAPHASAVTLVLPGSARRREIAMLATGAGYFEHREVQVEEGARYAYRLADGRELPDPASRWQPDGVHAPSAVFSPGDYRWSDGDWHGVATADLVIYELHVGAFTPEGTFEAIIPRLAALKELGVTAIELMPLAQFPGDRNWGYDGAYLYAVQASYGGARALQRLVDAAHQAGLGIILDVVYNHLGPEGNYLGTFGPYFTDRYHTPWGGAVNYDGPHSDAVRQFVVDNARMWVRDFHVDGLRLDAVQMIFDLSARHILADIQAAVQHEAGLQGRRVHVIGETNQNDMRLLRPAEEGGLGLDGVWSDEFHHALHALLLPERDGYYEDFGEMRHLAKAYNDVFVYDGCYSAYRQRRHGSPVRDADRSRFVVCIQNHDQVGNRPEGDRFGTLLPLEAQRLACTLLLLSPCTPLLFMGQEYGEVRAFPFFCSFGDTALMEAVRRGRHEEFADLAFQWKGDVPDPQAAETFLSAKLSWQWREGTPQAGMRRLHAELLAARHAWPALRDRKSTLARLAPSTVSGRDLLVLQRGGEKGILAIANPGRTEESLDAVDVGARRCVLSSESRRFGGRRDHEPRPDSLWPYEVLIFAQSE